MADEELLPPEGEERENAPVEAAQEQADDPVSKLASELGWAPKEAWQGDPERWKPADQFIRDGRDIQQTTARELRAMREQVERLGGVTTQIVQDKIAERDRYWEQQLTKAVDEGDTETALKLATARPTQQQPNGPAPEARAWIDRNAWFNTDHAARLRAQEVTERLAQQGLPITEQLAAAEKIVRKEFPEHFPAPVKQPPATQTAQHRNPGPSNRVKGFADMPQASQTMALDYEKRLGVKKEDFAKSYWADQQRKVG